MYSTQELDTTVGISYMSILLILKNLKKVGPVICILDMRNVCSKSTCNRPKATQLVSGMAGMEACLQVQVLPISPNYPWMWKPPD